MHGNLVLSCFGVESLPSEIYLPAYSYSPEEIFKGKILLFNVNFFREPIDIKPNYKPINNNETESETVSVTESMDRADNLDFEHDANPNNENYPGYTTSDGYANTIYHIPEGSQVVGDPRNQWDTTGYVLLLEEPTDIKQWGGVIGEPELDEERGLMIIKTADLRFAYKIEVKQEESNGVVTEFVSGDNNNAEVAFYYYEDESGYDIELTDGTKVKGYITSNQDSAVVLRGTISTWYNAIRNICLVLMLSILIYIGIRILLSSVASDKAKYQTMLKDWFVGLCLLFLMHYIMAFSVTMVDKLTEVVATSVDNHEKYGVHLPYKSEIEEDLKEIGMEESTRVDKEDPQKGWIWTSNLMGFLRLKSQYNSRGWQYIGEAIIFVTLVIFTVMFTFTYLKRLLHMAFLTLIAPLVALTYCIDKLNDGQAQGFNKWLKEYIFNLLIQPMHLLIYYILVTSAFDFLGDNVIYSMVAIGFMLPAEKLLRSLFGFEKAQTAPLIGPAAAMMASTGLSHLLHKGQKGKIGPGNSDGEENEKIGTVPNASDENKMLSFAGEEGGQPRVADTENPQEQELRANENSGSGDFGEQARQALRDAGHTEDEIRQLMGDTNPDSSNRREEEQSQAKIRQQKENSSGIKRAMKRKLHASLAARKAAMRRIPVNASKNFSRKIKNARPIRTMGKVATGAALGALAGGAGLAISMATGDGGNVVKMAGGLGAAGYSVGSGLAGRALQSGLDSPEIKEVYDTAYNKGEYKKDAMKDYVKNFERDVRNRNYFEQKMGKDETKKMIDSGEIEEFLKNEITDKKEMAAAHKLYSEGQVQNLDQAIMIAQLSQMIGTNSNHLTDKKQREWKTTIAGMAPDSIKDKDAFAERRFQELKKYDNYKK